MKDYSIEYASEKINSEKTKDYFKEVSSSYFNGNYRAAIVTLYSVVIHDIIVKLEALEDIYLDPVAKAILDEIKALQQANSVSSDWEKEIIEKVRARTSLLDNIDYAHIISLRNDRHLCAHPVIDKEYKLYTPNKESVAAHIRNMLESLFLKPPILSKKILSTILVDIASKKELLIDEESLERYIKSKFLNNLNQTIEITIFRDLWKFVFRLDDQPSEENRLINYRLLYFLYKRNLAQCIQKIKDEKEYFSNINNSKETINFLIRFISDNEFIYKEFRADVHLLINQQVTKDLNAKTVAWFLESSFTVHLEKIKELILNSFNSTPPYDAEGAAYRRLINIGLTKGYKEEVLSFIIWRYANSKNYNDGDKIYLSVVKPFFIYFDEQHFEDLCEQIKDKSQVCDRRQAVEDHEELKNVIISKTNGAFDFSRYRNIFYQI